MRNTRACAAKAEQKVPLRSSTGTLSMQCESSPLYSSHVGPDGHVTRPPASSTPNVNAPTPLSIAAPTCASQHPITQAVPLLAHWCVAFTQN